MFASLTNARLAALVSAALLLCGCGGALSAGAPGRSSDAREQPQNRRCVSVTAPALSGGQVSSTGTDTCVLAGQTFETLLYENKKVVDSQSGPCVSGCTLLVTHRCTKSKSSTFYAVAESNDLGKAQSAKVRLACR